jgi:hypothetical protein
MEAVVPPGEKNGLNASSFDWPDAKGNIVSYPLPQIGAGTAPYAGGPKASIIKNLIDESGPTVGWLAQNYNFHFQRPSGLAFAQYNIVTNYGSEEWNTGSNGYDSDDGQDLYKTTMFTRAVEKA